MENEGDYTGRLALFEESKNLPLGAVWNCHCLKHGIGAKQSWMDDIKQYESKSSFPARSGVHLDSATRRGTCRKTA
jgi:L-rhamnose isomerase